MSYFIFSLTLSYACLQLVFSQGGRLEYHDSSNTTTTTTPRAATTPASPPTEGQVRLADMPFAHHIQHPCGILTHLNRTNATRSTLSYDHVTALYAHLEDTSKNGIRRLRNLVNNSALKDCWLFNNSLPTLPNIPTLSALQRLQPWVALTRIYTSLQEHAAHAWFMKHQLVTDRSKCPNRKSPESPYGVGLGDMAIRQINLACQIHFIVGGHGWTFTPPTLDNIGFDEIAGSCIGRDMRDCRYILSHHALYRVIGQYAAHMKSARFLF